jgi:hypothetical protein
MEKNNMSENGESKPREYEMKGMQIALHLIQHGEFAWVPAPQTCSTEENVENMLDIIQTMPKTRRDVWIPRLDIPETIKRCPIIRQKASLNEKFTRILATDSNSQQPSNEIQKPEGGEQSNEQQK